MKSMEIPCLHSTKCLLKNFLFVDGTNEQKVVFPLLPLCLHKSGMGPSSMLPKIHIKTIVSSDFFVQFTAVNTHIFTQFKRGSL